MSSALLPEVTSVLGLRSLGRDSSPSCPGPQLLQDFPLLACFLGLGARTTVRMEVGFCFGTYPIIALSNSASFLQIFCACGRAAPLQLIFQEVESSQGTAAGVPGGYAYECEDSGAQILIPNIIISTFTDTHKKTPNLWNHPSKAARGDARSRLGSSFPGSDNGVDSSTYGFVELWTSRR